MTDFTFYAPTQFVFGHGAENKAGEMVRMLGGHRVLVHYGGGSCLRSGLLDRVLASLTQEGLTSVVLGGAQPNPRDGLVREGIALARREDVDFLLAIGGGSAIDSAKAMAVGIPYDGDFWDFFCGKAKPTRKTPLGVVLTIAAAGSEGSNSCVITKEDGMMKRGLGCELNRPQFALENPELTYTLPPYQTASGATDSMAHVLERYFTETPGVDLTDRLCEATLAAIVAAAPVAIREPDNYDARANLMWASTIAHNNSCGIGRVTDFASHQIEHELSAKYDCAHGAGLAVIFPAWMRYVLPDHVSRFAQLAVRLWGCSMDFEHPERTALAGIERFEQFLLSIGMPITLRALGAKIEDARELAEKTKRNNGDRVGYFTPLDTEDIIRIYEIANR